MKTSCMLDLHGLDGLTVLFIAIRPELMTLAKSLDPVFQL